MNPAPYNPRKDLKEGDAEYKAIKNSLESFGMLAPIIWNKRTGNIISGHQRYKILVLEGVTEIECNVVDFDEEKEKACNIAMNSATGDWDKDKLDELLFELQNSDFFMGDFGIDMSDFENVDMSDFEEAEKEKNSECVVKLIFPEYKDFEKIEPELKKLLEFTTARVSVQ